MDSMGRQGKLMLWLDRDSTGCLVISWVMCWDMCRSMGCRSLWHRHDGSCWRQRCRGDRSEARVRHVRELQARDRDIDGVDVVHGGGGVDRGPGRDGVFHVSGIGGN